MQKAGTVTVAGILHHGERVRRKRLSLLEAPGCDAVASIWKRGATL